MRPRVSSARRPVWFMRPRRWCAPRSRFIADTNRAGAVARTVTIVLTPGGGIVAVMGVIPMMPGDQTMVAMGITGVSGWP